MNLNIVQHPLQQRLHSYTLSEKQKKQNGSQPRAQSVKENWFINSLMIINVILLLLVLQRLAFVSSCHGVGTL